MLSFFKLINSRRKTFFLLLFFVFMPTITSAIIFDMDPILIAMGNLLITFASVLMFISSFVFDNMLAIGLSTELLEKDFIKVAWSNIRDMANIGFILGTIYISFSMLIGYGKWQKSLISLVVIIFTINFSLFFSRVIVDAGNITANVFLSAISITIDSHDSYFAPASAFYKDGHSTENFRSVGAVLNRALQPEGLLSVENFDVWLEEIKERERGGMYFLMALLMVAVIVMISKHLFVGAFMFLGRLVWIIYYMISSPIWFIAYFIPDMSGKIKSEWLVPLLNKSFCIVVYLVFLWAAVLFLQADMMSSIKESDDLVITMAILVIKGVFISAILSKGNSMGSKMCENGESTFGHISSGIGSVAGGVMRYTPVGGVARNLTGMVGEKIKDSGARMKTRGGLIGWAGDGLYGGGRSIMDAKVSEKSYADDQNERMKVLKELENEMSPEDIRKRKINRLKVGDGKGNMDLSKVNNFVDPKMQENFEKYQFVEDYKAGRFVGPLTPEQTETVEDVKAHEANTKELKEESPDDVILKEGFQKTGSVMSFLSPQAMASKNRMDEDRETKTEIAILNKKKYEKNKKEEVLRDEKKDNINALNEDTRKMTRLVNENNVEELESIMEDLQWLGDPEKDKLKDIAEKIKRVHDSNEDEKYINNMTSASEKEWTNSLSTKEKDRMVEMASKYGVETPDTSGEISRDSLREVFEGIQNNIKEEVGNKNIAELKKEVETMVGDYKNVQSRIAEADYSHQAGILREEIGSIDKKIQGVKADQEKADVRKKTVASEQIT